MSKLALFTVPHTGTHFAIGFMKELGIEHGRRTPLDCPDPRPSGFFHCHAPGCSIEEWNNGNRETIFSSTKCLVTARDPYLTGIRYIHNNQPAYLIVRHWNSFLQSLDMLPEYFVLDVGCRKEDRIQHLRDAAKFLGKDTSRYESAIEEYANKWIPLNVTNNGIKQAYLKTGELPKIQERKLSRDGSKILPKGEFIQTTLEIDWSEFDGAVAWYKSLPTNDA